MGSCSLLPRSALKDALLGSPPPLPPASPTRPRVCAKRGRAASSPSPAPPFLMGWSLPHEGRREPREKTLLPVCWGLPLGT